MKTITKKEAKKLCLKKWNWIVNKGGDPNIYEIDVDIPELKDLHHNCAYCELYFDNGCKGCPINLKHKTYNYDDACGCHEYNHPYDIWKNNSNLTNAIKVLNLIKEKGPKL